MNLAEKIRQCRRNRKLTQAELAKLIEVSPITERRWEWNERKPRADELARLAEALGTTTDYLLNGEKPEPEKPKKNLPVKDTNKNERLGLGYWGNVADNAREVAFRGDAEEIELIAPLLKKAYEMLAGVKVPQASAPSYSTIQTSNVNNGVMNVSNERS